MSADFARFADLTASIAEPGILMRHRVIADGDEAGLLAIEAACFHKAALKVKRQSGAARIAARELLAPFGHGGAAIAKAPSGAPIWPAGIVGSLAHDARLAVAAIAPATEFAGVGVDIEPAEDLPAELVDAVATPTERSRYDRALLRTRILFASKEAVYKAVHPLDGVFLDFHDIEVDLENGIARIRSGRVVNVRATASTHVVALAFVSASP